MGNEEFAQRMQREVLDSYDEELELELEDRPFDAEGNEIALTEQEKLERRRYFAELLRLQGELVKLQDWVVATGHKIVILFEGRDAAGKGGVIKRITQRLNPRVCRVAALPAPNDRERTQWYFQRYTSYLPAAGEMVLFDRSWYNRAGVERVMGYCTDEQYQRFLQQAPVFERGITDDGILLFKYWLCVDQALQEERFAERADEPLKSWKLSPIDLKAREKYADYTAAREAMLEATHTAHAPWTLVDFNDQRVGRLTLIRDLLDRLPDTRVPVEPLGLPPLRGKLHKERYGVLKPIKPQRGG
ncbi:MAG TPA: polyphosphate kinase 2 [Pseudoxanthomonas sp.]